MSTQARRNLSLTQIDIFILAILMVAAGIAYSLHWSFVIDDAAISFSYARNFAEGHGLGALYPGAPRVEGYSNFLWVVLLALGTKAGLDTVLVSKILGVGFTLGIMGLLFFSLRPFVNQSWMLLGLLLLPLSLTFSFWSASGLENSLYGFLIMLSIFFLLVEERRQATDPDQNTIPMGSAMSLVLVGMTRPEGLVYAVAGFTYKVLQILISSRDLKLEKIEAKNHTKKRFRSLVAWLIIFVMGYGLFKAWHYAYFAAWWPNPIYAKAGWQKTDLKQIWFNPTGWVYVRGYFRTFAGIWTIPALLLGGLVSLRGAQRVFPLFALAALVLPLYTPDWMLNYRFVYPFVPLSVALLVFAVDQLWIWVRIGAINVFAEKGVRDPALQNHVHKQEPSSIMSFFLLGVGLPAIILFAYGLGRFAWANLRLTQLQLACGYEPMAETRCLNGKMYWTMAEVEEKYVEIGNFAVQLGLDDPLYLIPDIGATSYVKGFRILDLAGLADFHLARIRQGAVLKQFLFEEQRPELIQTSGVWTRRTDLTSFQDFRQAYIPIEQGQDDDGVTHGTFVRRDLLIDPAPQGTNGVEMPGLALAPGIQLVKTNIQSAANPGQVIGFDTFWMVEQDPDLNSSEEGALADNGSWIVRVRLVNAYGQVIMEDQWQLGYGWYPVSTWVPGEVFRQHSRILLDVPEGIYRLDISLLSGEDTSQELLGDQVLSYQQELEIRQSAVESITKKLSEQLNQEIEAGDLQTAWGLLQQLEKASPDVQSLQSDIARLKMLFLADLLDQARGSYLRGDLETMLETIRLAAKVNLRAYPDAEWQKFSRELLAAAENQVKSATTEIGQVENTVQKMEYKDAYLLSLAASLADPSSTWAQRSLEKIRRLHLLGIVSSG